MTCRCKTKEEHAERAVELERSYQRSKIEGLEKELNALRADIKSFEIEDVEERKPFVVLQVKYEHKDKDRIVQKDCTFEGRKIMVFKAELIDVVRWREIDPHFRDVSNKDKDKDKSKGKSKNKLSRTKAPSPVARFPGNKRGWYDALGYCEFAKENHD